MEFVPFFGKIDSMETLRIPSYRYHEFFCSTGSYDAPVQELFSLLQPNEFMVRRQLRLRLAQCDDATPGPVVLHVRHSQSC
jgi:hypothetical protein